MDGSGSTQKQGEAVSAATVTQERITRLLSRGQMELLGQVLSSSNVIFLVRVDDGELQALAIYKPRRGERPLWDFPRGTLGRREVAAYVVSQALGWPLIPPIVLRGGVYGMGTIQLFIDADPEAHYFTFREERQADLLRVALFDVLVNNADRKGGHLLLDHWGRMWAIDNALTFHAEPKLRTVIWDFAGEPMPQECLEDLQRLQERLIHTSSLYQVLSGLLHEDEVAALKARLARMLAFPVLPRPDPNRRQVPWPVI